MLSLANFSTPQEGFLKPSENETTGRKCGMLDVVDFYLGSRILYVFPALLVSLLSTSQGLYNFSIR